MTAMLLAAANAFASGPSEFVIYQFPDTFAVGATPNGNLIADRAGNLYGTAQFGGAFNHGTVFELVKPVPPATAWGAAVLFDFPGGSGGGSPLGALTFDNAGNLYGMGGVVFRLSPPTTAGNPWTETVLHTFQGSPNDGDGSGISGVVFDAAGNLYGATMSGGTVIPHNILCQLGCGVVYELSPTDQGEWTETVIHYFNGGQGARPAGTPTFDAHGRLYGLTEAGGLHGDGTAYRLLPPTTQGGAWNFRVIYQFGSSLTDSVNPQSSLTVHGSGILYGAAQFGGQNGVGTVFALSPPTTTGGAWTESILHDFASGTDGNQPTGNVIFDHAGNLYGATGRGGGNGSGCNGGCGVVYELTPGTSVWTETVLHAFPSSSRDASVPNGGLLLGKNGVLYGAAGTAVPTKRGAIYGIVP
jgi:hypothetical protein